MSPRIVNAEELTSLVGEHLGYSPYVTITQEQVNLFADATGDHQWIHVDVDRANAGPFGGPIAHGYLTLSLGPSLYPQIVQFTGFSMGINYGANKIRFPSPVMVGSNLRLGVKLLKRGRDRRRRPEHDGVHVRMRGRQQAQLRRRDRVPQLLLTHCEVSC